MSADVRHDASILDALDFAPDVACEYSMHWLVPSDPAAEWWIVVAPSPCGCQPLRVRAFCDPCKERRTSSKPKRCNECAQLIEDYSGILHMERIR